MEPFDFTKAEVVRETGEVAPVDDEAVNAILRLDLDIKELEQRQRSASSSYEENADGIRISELIEERAYLEMHLDQHGWDDLNRLRMPSGGV